MKRDLGIVLISLLFAVTFSVAMFGQGTTGSIEITVRDPNGAVVPGVTLTIETSAGSTGFKRTVTTDDIGFARLLQVPPGAYSITTAALKGFAAKTLTGVEVGLGRTTQVTFVMTVAVTGIACDRQPRWSMSAAREPRQLSRPAWSILLIRAKSIKN